MNIFDEVYNNNLKIVREYIECKGNLELRRLDDRGETLLMVACYARQIMVVKELIKAGVDVNAKDNNGHTALMKASEYGHSEIVTLLIRAGVDVNAKDHNGYTALMKALVRDHCEVVDKLLRVRATFNDEKVLSFCFLKNVGDEKITISALKTEKEVIYKAGILVGHIDELRKQIVAKYGATSEYEKEIVNLFNKLNN